MPTDPQWYAVAISVAALIASGLSAFYSWQQARIAQRVADISERSAKSSEESAKAARDALNLGSRAWITIKDADGTERDNSQVPNVGVAHYVNSGTTPASGISAQAWLRAFAPNPERLPLHERGVIRQEDLGASCENSITARAVFQAQDYRDIAEGRKELYFYGSLKYSDASGRQHGIKWCYRYLPQTQRFHPDVLSKIVSA